MKLNTTDLDGKLRSAAKPERVFGVRVRLHYTWYIAFLLIIAVITTQFPEVYPLWQRMVLGVATGLLFFIAISIRELILGFLATRRRMPVKDVTLFVLGGVYQIARETTRPVLELLLAFTGLLSNMVIAGIFYGAYLALANSTNVIIAGLIQWLAFIIFMLALFHFVPGFPLDGGRVLRALLWRTTGNYERAARIASRVGQGIGLLLVVGGIVVMVFYHQWFVGLFLAFVGWVLQSAATHSRNQVLLYETLRSIVAQNIMTKEYSVVNPQLSLSRLVRDYIMVTGQRYFVVADEDKLQGIVTARNIRSIPRGRWKSTRVGKVMTPVGKLKTAYLQQSGASLLELMDGLGINQIPVLEEDEVIGVVVRDSLMRLVKTRTRLGV